MTPAIEFDPFTRAGPLATGGVLERSGDGIEGVSADVSNGDGDGDEEDEETLLAN